MLLGRKPDNMWQPPFKPLSQNIQVQEVQEVQDFSLYQGKDNKDNDNNYLSTQQGLCCVLKTQQQCRAGAFCDSWDWES